MHPAQSKAAKASTGPSQLRFNIISLFRNMTQAWATGEMRRASESWGVFAPTGEGARESLVTESPGVSAGFSSSEGSSVERSDAIKSRKMPSNVVP